VCGEGGARAEPVNPARLADELGGRHVAVERAAARREARLARPPITTIEEAISLIDAASEEGAWRPSSRPSGTARRRRSRLGSKMRSRLNSPCRGCRSIG
jgi:hypothetical protein